jgi:type I restriction enzyme M protein
MELLPATTFGIGTNGQEDYLFQVERTRFEVRAKPLSF